MSEIDDTYDTNTEELEQAFFEEIETGKDRKKTLNKYVENLDKLREKRETAYKTYLLKQKKEIWKKKKKKEKKKTYKHLQVQHFEFKFNTWEKTKQKLDVTWFKTKRHILTTYWTYMPRFLLRWYYHFKKDMKQLKETITEYYNHHYKKTKKTTTKIGKWTWKNMKITGLWIWNMLKKTGTKITFWKKKEENIEENEGKKEKKEGTTEEQPTNTEETKENTEKETQGETEKTTKPEEENVDKKTTKETTTA